MADFNKIVEGFFHKKENLLGTQELNSLLFNEFKKRLAENKKHLKEDMEQVAPVKKQGPRTITYNSIADIAVSELGWAGLNTSNTGIVEDSKRQQLEQYLKNIAGNTFDEKIKAINSFYTASVEDLVKMGIIKASTRSQKIQQMISYLVFLKTLTTIITNFNASAAGFAFEAFLSVLLNGQQIPASGATTIADVTIQEAGQTVYASLKLYSEKSLEVGGSFRDLVNDMVDPKKPFIRYIAGLKSLSGKGLDMEGRVAFHKFDINIDNIMNIMVNTSKHSRACIILPKEYIDSRGQTSFESRSNIQISEEQIFEAHQKILTNLLKTFINKSKKLLPMQKQPLINNIINTVYKVQKENDDFFLKKKEKMSSFGYAEIRKNIPPAIVSEIILQQKDKKMQDFLNSMNEPIQNAISLSYKQLIDYVHKATSSDAQKEAVDAIKWAKTPEECVEFYNTLSKEEKAKALKNTLGFLRERQFSMSRNQMFEATETGAEKIGEIIIGKKNIQELLNKIGNELDDSVFEIFDNLASLTNNINKYFATGLQDDAAADQAQQAAVNIDKKTEEVQTQTKANV